MIETDEALVRQVGDVLRLIWDPIQLRGIGPLDEYDSYVPCIIRLVLTTTVSEAEMAAHLTRIETDEMGLDPAADRTTRAARALFAIREGWSWRPHHLARLLINDDGSQALIILHRSDGLFSFEHIILQWENDINGACSWWSPVVENRSGLFAELRTAERDACSRIDWLSQPSAIGPVQFECTAKRLGVRGL